ncbi:hypothetical protein F5884DRAFT_760060 [Xylogone sp. PMI_703]|nr:hypothetical protein F5884DRAFT_760060 [Xylogone sp. PMI_703]
MNILIRMPYHVTQAKEDDILEMADVMIAALLDDPCWQAMKGSWSYEEEHDFIVEILFANIANRAQAIDYTYWKVVDANEKILAWAGLELPNIDNEEEKQAARNKYYQIPPGRNQKIVEFFRDTIIPSTVKHGYDNKKHCHRQNIMVRPEYQRRGFGRLLTEKCNEAADAEGVATYVRARPGAADLFIKMGYEVLERIDFDLNGFGAEGGKTAVFIMKREPVQKGNVEGD